MADTNSVPGRRLTPVINMHNGTNGTPTSLDTEDRLYQLLHDGQVRQERLLEGLGGKMDKLADACVGMRDEIKALQVTPSLIRTMTYGMVVVIILVGIAAGAQVAVSAGWFQASTAPAAEASP